MVMEVMVEVDVVIVCDKVVKDVLLEVCEKKWGEMVLIFEYGSVANLDMRFISVFVYSSDLYECGEM